MAVMTSSALDEATFDIKAAAAYPAADAMALDTETANGIHDVLFDEPEAQPTANAAPPATDAQSQPIVNGNHAPLVTESTTIPNGIEPIAPILLDHNADTNSLFGGSDSGAISIQNAVEAPTSDVRDDPESAPVVQPIDTIAATKALHESTRRVKLNESAQEVPETGIQLPDVQPLAEAGSGDAKQSHVMEISQNVPQRSQAPISPPPDSAPTKPMKELKLETQQTAVSSPQLTNIDHEMEDAPTSGKVRSREEDDEEDVPDAKRTKTETEDAGEVEFRVPEAPVQPAHTNGNGVTQASQAAQMSSTDPPHIQPAVTAEVWPTTPMTQVQNKFLLERVRNTKKIKVATFFREPVDPEVLNIPTYHDFVKNPMDLSTMETKLKNGQYPLVYNFMEDLDLIIDNSILFNGKEHPVTQAGYNMRAYFLKGVGKMPKAGIAEPVKVAKPKKPTVSTSAKARRDPKAPATTAKSPSAPTPTAASPPATWPLNADGTPLIRRDSSTANDRPKREIHRPPPKDLPYNTAKPRKKKYQQEIRFCESVLSELMKPKYQRFSYPFLVPVDPVALNIPSYLKIIKKPMDFGTIEKNLKAGQYQTAKDFYNDAQLVFQNCYKFNPEGDEVNKMGKQLNELFDSLWKEKTEWLAQHAPASDPQSPGSAYSDDEEEEEEEELDPAQAQIIAIQQQIAQLNETAQSLLQQQKGKRASPKAPSKKKASKPPAPKKKNSLAVPPPPKPGKSKPRTKAPAPLSFAQKQEISDGISTLGDADMRRAVQIIRNGCPHLANVNDDEMEIDMDEIGDDTLRELFKFIKQVRGPKGTDDDEFEPPRPSHKPAATKPKKNKPMGKKEQEDSIKRIQDQLRRFEGSASGSSQSPPANQDESSGDDESSGSESEEE